MHKLDNGYKERFNKNEMEKMFETYNKETFKCSCGHSVAIPYNMGKRLCTYCGKYVFRDKQEEFKYRLKEVISWKERI